MINQTLADLEATLQVFFTDGALSFWNQEGEINTYQLLQFHVHAPSEHTFDGVNHDLEVHFVHKHFSEKRYAVIAVYFDISDGGN